MRAAEVITWTRSAAARLLLNAGVSANAMTVLGLLGTVAGAVGFAARGQLLIATAIVTAGSLCDALDGMMARLSGGGTRFGALLDSASDRIGDGVIFTSLAFWPAGSGRPRAAAALCCLVAAYLVSYVRARAEGLGVSGEIGIAHRYLRLKIAGVGALLGGLGLIWALEVTLWVLTALSTITVAQRFVHAQRQFHTSHSMHEG
ncbi:CDP-alcohol phosphatidyltransferase family protein [Streptosporangium sp. NBC_01810]|uniref:phosphatidylinositol phosphate synthase n=1 Tax=Streptosporangium sp. NBC_01810 TaxID=2975951 RepID=UPI002DD8D6FA|nr:CDP-alcohol phosphatidyltransferase family protein [Streptosporangium sp. NBC_01810]WSA26040.1 CDP-alcohol phosphatidyltransferase family protein [Streptosporangium sp. NBC_01810]